MNIGRPLPKLAAAIRANAEARTELEALRRRPGAPLTSDTPSIRYDIPHSWIAARRGPQGPETQRFGHLQDAFEFTEAGQ